MKQTAHASYENLIVYQKSKQLTLDLVKYLSYNKKQEYNFIVTQLLRSSSSIGANITEGYGKHYKQSYRQFIRIARGSSFETSYWLDLLSETTREKEKLLTFTDANTQISKMLTKLMKNLEN